MTITLELPTELHQKATVLATDCNQSLDTLLVGLIGESLGRMTYGYPNGLASLAEEDAEFCRGQEHAAVTDNGKNDNDNGTHP